MKLSHAISKQGDRSNSPPARVGERRDWVSILTTLVVVAGGCVAALVVAWRAVVATALIRAAWLGDVACLWRSVALVAVVATCWRSVVVVVVIGRSVTLIVVVVARRSIALVVVV